MASKWTFSNLGGLYDWKMVFREEKSDQKQNYLNSFDLSFLYLGCLSERNIHSLTNKGSHQRCSAGLGPATLLKKRLWHRCFPVNFAKFLRTPFLQNTSSRLLLNQNTLMNWISPNDRKKKKVSSSVRLISSLVWLMAAQSEDLASQKKLMKSLLYSAREK